MSDADEAFRIAEARIERARETGATVLSLSPRVDEDGESKGNHTPALAALARLPPTIADLSGVTALHLSSTQVADLAPLAGLTGLQTLNLTETQAADLAPLAGLARLQVLNFSGTDVAGLAPLAGLSSLQVLGLGGTEVADLAPLASLSGLLVLHLGSTEVADLAPLAGLSELRELDLGGAQITDLAPLAGLTALDWLDLSYTDVADLAPLAGLSGLQELDLNHTQVADLAPIVGMVGLRQLRLASVPADPVDLVSSGAAWESEDREIETLVITRSNDDPTLAELVEDPHNPGPVLARLRELRDARARAEPAPPSAAREDWTFTAGDDGRLTLADSALDGDADQATLQAELAAMAAELKGALAGSNEFASAASAAADYAALLRRDPEEIGARRVWTLANRFRLLCDAQEAAAAEDRPSDLMPPAARAALEGLAANGGVWLLAHPGVAEVEAAARAYLTRPGAAPLAEAAAPIVDVAAENPEAVEPAAVAPAAELRRQRGVGGPIGDLASGPLVGWAQGLVGGALRALRGAVRWTGRGFIVVGGVAGGMRELARMVLASEAPIRAFVTAWAPQATPYLNALIEALKAAAL